MTMIQHLSISHWCFVAFVMRLLMMLYGHWQDNNMVVKYTDVDYYVFTDAARFVTQGESPYLRSTYRYPPVLAWILTLNIYMSPMMGKLIFVIFDILVGLLIYRIVLKSGSEETMAKNCALVWLVNILPATVSTRGNAESLMAFLVLQSLDFFLDGSTVLGIIFYTLSIHFKIYPVTFALPIYFYLRRRNIATEKGKFLKFVPLTRKNFFASLWPTGDCRMLILLCSTLLGTLTLFNFYLYGFTFLYETYLYHIVRGDIRHNFSPYFYLLYLMSDPVSGLPLHIRLLLFFPQMVLLFAIAWRFQHDPPMSWFLCTFCFVMANKVCTSQYFLWYLSLLPVVIPRLKMSAKRASCLVGSWLLSQAVWLFCAYLLEFEGYNTFLLIWVASLLFFGVNGFIAYTIIDSYCGLEEQPPKTNNKETRYTKLSS